MQLKRRDTYSQLSAHKRETLLLSRRLQTDSTRLNLLENSTIATPTQSTSSCYRDGFPKQVALVIREPPALPQKATSHQVQPTQPQDSLNKGKQVYNPLAISQTTTNYEIRTHILHNLDKEKQVSSPSAIFETGKSALCLTFCSMLYWLLHYCKLWLFPRKGPHRLRPLSIFRP